MTNGKDDQDIEAMAAQASQDAPEPDTADVTDDPVPGLEAEVAALKERLLRTLAEVENTRRRHERALADERVYAIEKFARDLLPVSDNFARAMEAVTEDALAAMGETGRALFTGVEMTQKALHAVLVRHGVTAVEAGPGTAFDPNLHQAVSQIPSTEPRGTIAACFAPGWKIGERVLRAAMVAVSAGEG